MAAPVIGIIGGAGVAASIELLARMERMVTDQGAFRDSQHPEVLLYQATQVPSRSMFLEGRGESFTPGYIEAARKLKDAGSVFGAMCCNTAHHAIDEISQSSGLPFIDVIEECFKAVKTAAPSASTIGVLCSDGTRKAQIYEKVAHKLGLKAKILQPDAAHQAKVTLGICNIKKAYHRHKPLTDDERPAKLFHAAADHLAQAGANVIILGCTEIPLDFATLPGPAVPTIDSIDVLAQACLQRYRQLS